MNFYRNIKSSEFQHILSNDALKGSSLAADGGDDMIDFLVTNTKQKHYLAHCDEVVEAKDPFGTINKYTDHTTKVFAHVNLSLAADSPVIKDHAQFIKELSSSILSQPLLDDGYLVT
eukprot:TRINITY_DN4781_c0_g1_i2.p1 TRINITY_DN4781_c0_g1~~TRINITY_DN4781_c0_g1_i2.p1  ORF type:complete len:117 (+),score=22.70 TRINITY_DN4781_c0_g1_i2:110-460(+)